MKFQFKSNLNYLNFDSSKRKIQKIFVVRSLDIYYHKKNFQSIILKKKYHNFLSFFTNFKSLKSAQCYLREKKQQGTLFRINGLKVDKQIINLKTVFFFL